MTWVKVDDLFPDHPKVRGAGTAAAWLYVAGLCYCARFLTDGFIADVSLAGLGQYGKSRARTLAEKLVEVKLWEQVDGGYQVHDYLDFQPSRSATQQQRETKRRAGQAGGQASAVARATGPGSEKFNPRPQPVPSPTRPQPPPSEGAEAAPNIFRLYEQTIGPFDPHMATKLEEAETEYSQECIRHSFQEASENNARSWRYVETILKAHKRNGCYSDKRRTDVGANAEVLERHERQMAEKLVDE